MTPKHAIFVPEGKAAVAVPITLHPAARRRIPDANAALRYILSRSHADWVNGRLLLALELDPTLEDFLATFEAETEDLEDSHDAEPNGDEGDYSVSGIGFALWQGGSTE